MAVEWFCQVMGSEVGPLTQLQLIDMVRHHQITPEDLVRRGGSQWVPAFEVKGLFEAAAKPPPEEPAPKPPVEEKTEAKPAAKPKPVDEAVAAISATSRSATDWFCIASGEKRGPLCFDELQALAKQGTLRGRDRVWRGAWPKYQTAAEVDGLEATG